MRLHCLATLATVALVVAKPHLHVHRRAHGLAKRARHEHTVEAPVAIETVITYVLDGHIISEEDVHQGLANGTLIWANDGILSTSTTSPVIFATPPPSPASASQQQQVTKPGHTSDKSIPATPASAKPAEQSSAISIDIPSANPAPKPSSEPAPVLDTAPKSAQELVDGNGNCASCDKVFPNGNIPCSKFPYGYGAMPLQQEGLGGWSGIQDPGYRGADGFDNIRTVVSGSCRDGSCCTPGTWCSYGCPNPYLKLSFPKKQGRTGQTVGGLYCNNNGMLEMADGSIGDTLCGKDSQHMTVKVQNKLSKPVSICRTDYPGTESMTFPLTIGPGETGYLANPDQSKYFFWENKPTSAHYYINKQGVSEAEGCTWGNPTGDKGNWAPAIFGTSFDDMIGHEGYSSLKQNELNKNDLLDYSITFTGNGVVDPCSYRSKAKQYCRGNDCWNDRDQGCTAAIRQGSTLTLVLHDDD